MANFHDLPEEILHMIFSCGLWARVLMTMQRVCRAWYRPAHLILLRDIKLDYDSAIAKFVKSIDHNPNPAYLKAVKNIIIVLDTDEVLSPLDEDLIQKLFMRFPNLKDVRIQPRALLENFNDEICRRFLLMCPKLEVFDMSIICDEVPRYNYLIRKVRLLATEVDLGPFDNINGDHDVTQLLDGFPRLRVLTGFANCLLVNFKQLLQILETSPNLNSVEMGSDYDAENSAEDYLTAKLGDEQSTLITRLSNIRKIGLYYCMDDYCLNSLRFVLKYMTGLVDISFHSEYNEDWSEDHRRVFCSLFSEIHRLKNYCIEVYNMDLSTLSKCFPTIVQKTFTTITASAKRRDLNLRLHDSNDICVTLDRFNVEINLTLVEKELPLSGIAQHFFEAVYNNVDTFDLRIKGRSNAYDNPTANIHSYDMILGQMPSLKKLSLDITTDFDDNSDVDGCGIELPLVKTLKIRATVDAKFQSLLDSYHIALPNLKHLALYYHTGNWEEAVGEFRVQLPKYSLNSLLLDVTPVKTKTVNVLGEDTFFVLEVEILSTNVQHLFKVSLDLSEMTKVNHGDLKGLIRGEDYYLVRLTIGSLKNLKLFATHHEYIEGDEDYTESYASQVTVIFRKNTWKVKRPDPITFYLYNKF